MTVNIRVLIADDHPVVREGLGSMLYDQTDIEVVGEAGTGEDAIKAFEILRPDVVLLDLKLPDMDGIDVIQAIRSLDQAACVLVLTTYGGDVQAKRALTSGAAGYLLKASLRRDLRDSIRAVHDGTVVIQPEMLRNLLNILSGKHSQPASLTFYSSSQAASQTNWLRTDSPFAKTL